MTRRDHRTEDAAISASIDAYERLRPLLDAIADLVRDVLNRIVADLGIDAIVQSRVKTMSSFVEKLIRKSYIGDEPLTRMNDLCGARVITASLEEVESVCARLREAFVIDEALSEDAAARLQVAEFGYRSVHLGVKLDPERLDTTAGACDTELGERVRDRWRALAADDPEIAPAWLPRMEIQVRTVLQHAWATFSHDRFYKTDMPVPSALERESRRVAALLEEADTIFSRTTRMLSASVSAPWEQGTAAERRGELEILETIHAIDPVSESVAWRLARYAMSLGDWSRAAEVLSDLVERADMEASAHLLADLGSARHRDGRERGDADAQRAGRDLLARAVALDDDPVLIAKLAEACLDDDPEAAADLFSRAFMAAPDSSRILIGYLMTRSGAGSITEIAAPLAPVIHTHCELERQKIRRGLATRRTLFDTGLLQAVLGDMAGALDLFAQGVNLSDEAGELRDELARVSRLAQNAGEGSPLAAIAMLLSTSLAGFERSATSNEGRRAEEPRRDVVVILCAALQRSDPAFRRYVEILAPAMAALDCTLVFAGEGAVVAELVDALDRRERPSRIVAYVERSPGDNELRGAGITRIVKALVGARAPAVSVWSDMLSQERPSGQVRVLGLGDGQVADTDLRIAAAMAGPVATLRFGEPPAVVEGGRGRPVMQLPFDAQIVRLHLRGIPPARALPAAVLEVLARQAHERYRRDQGRPIIHIDPSLSDWEHLPEDLRRSNISQISHIEDKLDCVGLKLEPSGDAPGTGLENFSPEQEEILAELEHARWSLERLQAGWRLGRERDIAARTTPHLVPWSSLDGAIRRWDFDAVRNIPTMLREVGFAIVPRDDNST